MPFRHYPQPSLKDWRPGRKFDQATDRLRVDLNYHDDSLILAWSSDGDEAGGLVLAPEAIPVNLFRRLLGVTDARSIEQGLFVKQSLDTNHLVIELQVPKYYAKFVTRGGVMRIHPLSDRDDRCYTEELAGFWRVEPEPRRIRKSA